EQTEALALLDAELERVDRELRTEALRHLLAAYDHGRRVAEAGARPSLKPTRTSLRASRRDGGSGARGTCARRARAGRARRPGCRPASRSAARAGRPAAPDPPASPCRR